MNHPVIISTEELAAQSGNSNLAIVDCRFKLGVPDYGREAYLAEHIPGAVYAHLDDDLSGPIIEGETGRHPLPAVEIFQQLLSSWGIDSETTVVAYDDASSVYAGRLWWMLKWMGHDSVSVLDGDWRKWKRENRPVKSGEETRRHRPFVPVLRPEMQVSVDDVAANIAQGRWKVFDSRDESRYEGHPNPLDPVAGHIPGAVSAWFARNLDSDGCFLPPETLKARFDQLLAETLPEDSVFYCGSGVSVHNNLIALALAGFSELPRVYIGSWSHWISDPNRPVETTLP
ncbi:MAG: sulfurtransferase [Planctomycetaceae bacterium]|nr:sulfurtransferase [Planctomycetaceae bacterium]